MKNTGKLVWTCLRCLALLIVPALCCASRAVLAQELPGYWSREADDQGAESEYWYEHGVKQGVRYREDGATDPSYRGKEIYDPASDAWYWLDAAYGGRKAVSKDVYQESSAGIWGETVNAAGEHVGKWVRYDRDGRMVKGWCAGTGENAVRIDGPEAAEGQSVYYFDYIYGTMAKGFVTIDGVSYEFDVITGVLRERDEGAVQEALQAARGFWDYVKWVDTDPDGNVISFAEREFCTRGGNAVLRSECTYDADGRTTERITYDADGYPEEYMYYLASDLYSTTYEHDPATHKLLRQSTARNGWPYESYEFRYDQNGSCVRETYYQRDASGKEAPVSYIVYAYEDGRETERFRYELGRRGTFYLCEKKHTDYAQYGDAFLTAKEETEVLAENGVSSYRLRTEYKRDEKGILQEILDEYASGKNEYRPASHTYYHYDGNGNQILTESYSVKNGEELLSDRREYIYAPYCYTEDGEQYSGEEQTAYHIWTFYTYSGSGHTAGEVDFYRGGESFYSGAFVCVRENFYTQDRDGQPVIDYYYLYQYDDSYADTREHDGGSFLLSRQKYGSGGQLESTRTYDYRRFPYRRRD